MTAVPKVFSYSEADRLQINYGEFVAPWEEDKRLVSKKLRETRHRQCPMCEQRIQRFCYRSITLQTKYDPPEGNRVAIDFCKECGFWYADEAWNCIWSDEQMVTYTLGILKSYGINDIDVPIHSLRSFLVKNPDHVGHTNPTAFEKLMAECLRAEFAPCEVIHVGQSHDKGIDLKLINSDKQVFLVQIKRRQNLMRKESVTVVRELNGVLLREGTPKGMIITTALDFTKPAKEETKIKTLSLEQYQVELRSFNDVCRMLRLPREPKTITIMEPWRKHLSMAPANENEYRNALNNAVFV